MAGRAWTTGEVRRVKEMRAAGESYRDIGNAISRSAPSVKYMLIRLGLTDGRGPASEADVLRWHACGLCNAAIARKIGRSPSAVGPILKRKGLRPNRRSKESIRASTAGRLRAMAKDNWTVRISRERAAAAGWPETNGPKKAAVLQALLDHGPCRISRIRDVTGLSRFAVETHLRRLLGIGQAKKTRGRPVLYDLAGWLRARKEFKD